MFYRYFILTLKIWCSLRAVSPTGRKLGQVIGNRLCRKQIPWVIGTLEYWNYGSSGMRSLFYIDDADPRLKSGHHPLLIPYTPSFQL
jgi:hypothetical protein